MNITRLRREVIFSKNVLFYATIRDRYCDPAQFIYLFFAQKLELAAV